MRPRDNRAFLGRAVHYLAADAGIRQFLAIGTGRPTQGNVHEVAQAANPDSRVVYADNDRCKSGCAHPRRRYNQPVSWGVSVAPRPAIC